jgi:hypothetical protein
MKTNIKIIIASITILILTLAAGTFYVSRSYKKNVEQLEPAVQIDKAKILLNAEKERAEKAGKFKTVSVSKVDTGIISSINGDILNIKINDSEIKINITSETTFYLMEGGNPVMKSKDDIKEGIEIVFEYDEKTKNALSVNIIKK